MIKPHHWFEDVRADEVAETWEGVSNDLYERLWNVVVPLQKPIPNIEDSGPHDHIGHENLASHWHHLTESEQELLNKLAEAKQAEFRKWLDELGD